MELHLRIKTISIFWCNILRLQNWIRIPTITIPISPILLIATCLCFHFHRLLIFTSLTKSWINLIIRINISSFSCTLPFIWLNQIIITIQAGWDLCNSVLPYLWLEAFFDLSIRASLAILKPVVASPLRFILISGLWKIYLVFVANVFACKLSARSLGINPPYPGMWCDRGEVESYVKLAFTGLWWWAYEDRYMSFWTHCWKFWELIELER